MSCSKSIEGPPCLSLVPRAPARVAFLTLGCPKNLVDSEVMMGRLERAGFTLVADESEADLLVINTCAFVQDAQRESIDRILRAGAWKAEDPSRRLLVAGCLAERHGAALQRAMPEIDGLLGPGRCDRIAVLARALAEGRPSGPALGALERPPLSGRRVRTGFPHVAYVKIAEGCSHRCRFCLIPKLRGPLRSRSIESVAREVIALAEEGVREVILVAQDTTAFGRERDDGASLARLLRRLNAGRGPEWIRVLYTHPAHWNDELIAAFAEGGRVLPYIDLPIQHISDPVLRAMGRGAGGARIRRLVDRLRARIPNVILRTTVMTGHPGEGEREFAELMRFLREFPFDRLGAFAYSREPELPRGPGLPCASRSVARRRRSCVLSEQKEIARRLQRARRGQECTVLIDGIRARDGAWVARSYGEAPDIDGVILVRAARGKKNPDGEPGDFRRVRILEAKPYDLKAVPVESFPLEPHRRAMGEGAWKEEA